MNIRQQSLEGWLQALRPSCSLRDLAHPAFAVSLLERVDFEFRDCAGLEEVLSDLRHKLSLLKMRVAEVSAARVMRGSLPELRKFCELLFLYCLENDCTGDFINATLGLPQELKDDLLELKDFSSANCPTESLFGKIAALEETIEDLQGRVQAQPKEHRRQDYGQSGQLRRVKSEFELERLKSASEHDQLYQQLESLEQAVKEGERERVELEKRLQKSSKDYARLKEETDSLGRQHELMKQKLAAKDRECELLRLKCEGPGRDVKWEGKGPQLKESTKALLKQRLQQMQTAHLSIRCAMRGVR